MAYFSSVKLIAFILMSSFSAYLSEAVMLPYHYITIAKTKADRCTHTCKMMQQNKKCYKETSKNKGNQCCSNCPVFAGFYAADKNTTSALAPVFILHHTHFINGFISNYANETWKPPNAL